MKMTQFLIYIITMSMVITGTSYFYGGLMSKWGITGYQDASGMDYLEDVKATSDQIEESLTKQQLDVPQEEGAFTVVTGAYETLTILMGSFNLIWVVMSDITGLANIGIPSWFLGGVAAIVFILIAAAVLSSTIKRDV